MQVEGKRVIVTAAADGIGRAIAEAFLDGGARVHVCDVNAGALDAFKAERPDLGAHVTDVSDGDAVDALFDAAEADLGGLDVLVNNAGIAGPTGTLESMTGEEWRRTLDVNVVGMFHCLKRALPLMKAAGGGAVVNLASSAGVMGYPLRTPYAASKWAVIGLTKSLAMEAGPDGVRVNAICPGPVTGDRMERVIAAEAAARGVAEDDIRASYTSLTSLRSFIAPEEIAASVLFLCSDAAAKITGQVLSVDGNTETLR